MSKVLSITLTAVLTASIVTVFCGVQSYGETIYNQGSFTDINKSNWAYEAVSEMSERAIIKGFPDGSFKPANTVTYGEFIKMAILAAGENDAGNALQPEHWAMNYYEQALKSKYFTSFDIHQSQLNYQIPRGDMALILSAVLGDVKIENYDAIQDGIRDVTSATEHEYDITKAYSAGILTGYEDSTFKPERTLSRAEAALVIYRLVDASKRVLPLAGMGEQEIKTYPTSGLLDLEKLTPDKTIASSVKFTEEYELYTDASVWGMKMYRAYNGESCSFDHTLRGFIYLIKDGEIVEFCNTGPRYDSRGNYLYYQRSRAEYDISKADYIICVPSNAEAEKNDLIKVVKNPFLK